MKKKKKKKIKIRRHISSSTLFPKKEAFNLMVMRQSLERAFPDPVKRKEYIDNFLKKVDSEKTIPDEQIGSGDEQG